MKIALIGYGKMGQTIEKIALERNHEIAVIIDKDNQNDFESDAFKDVDMAIEFSMPETALNNYHKCFKYNIPVVSGTTGWLEEKENLKKEIEQNNYAFLYSSNFSVGVNILFWLNKQLAGLMNNLNNYNVSMTEVHHIHKKDAPSGTALTLANDLIKNIQRLDNWKLNKKEKEQDLPIESIREGEVFGIHEIKYEAKEDILKISHEAKSREGFALGAVMAAEFLKGKTGFYSMEDVLNF